MQGDATNVKLVEDVLKDADAAVHAIGLLFDVDSGLQNLNKIVSGSGSIPDSKSTYDAITRTTAFNVIDTIERNRLGISSKEIRGFLCALYQRQRQDGQRFLSETQLTNLLLRG